MSSSQEDIVKIIHRRSNPIHYRPVVQDILFKNENHFDGQYSALQLYISKYKTYYDKAVLIVNTNLINSIKNEIQKALKGSFLRLLSLSLITSYYSVIDNNKLIDLLINNTISDNSKNNIIQLIYRNNLYYKNNNISDILVCLFDLLFYQVNLRFPDGSFLCENKVKKILNNSIYLPEKALKCLYDEYCNHVNSVNNDDNNVLIVIILPDINLYSTELLSELLYSLHELNINIQLIAFQSPYTESPLSRLLSNASSIIDISYHCSSDNTQLYDYYFNEIISDQSNIISLPIFTLNDIFDDFFSGHRCVSTVHDHIVSILIDHFSHRRSLLGMFMEVDWLREMRLVVTRPQKKEDSFSHAIHILLPYLDANDIDGTDLILALKPASSFSSSSSTSLSPPSSQTSLIDKSNEIEHAEKLLSSYYISKQSDFIIYLTLKCLRDNILEPQLRKDYLNYYIYTAILQDQVKHITLKKKQNKQVNKKMKTTNETYNIYYELINHIKESLTHMSINTIKSTVNDLLIISNQFNNQIYGYKLHNESIDRIIDKVNQQFDVITTLLNGLQDLLPEGISSNLSIKEIEIYKNNLKDVELPIDPLATPPTINPKNIEKQNKLTKFLEFFSNFTFDFIKRIHEIILEYKSFILLSKVSGILEVNFDVAKTSLESSLGLIRRKTVDGIINFQKFLPSNKNIQLDMTILTNRILKIPDKVSSANLFEYFKEMSSEWIKTKKNSINNDNEILWHRYVLALDNLQRTGLCSVQSTKVNNTHVSYVARNIFTFTDDIS